MNADTQPAAGDAAFMVFDVESVGLHGEGFAVGYVVVTDRGVVLEEATLACSPDHAQGNSEDRRWVRENVPVMEYDYLTPDAVRNCFWARWMFWKAKGASLVADCCWPVEARFLAACVDDAGGSRAWEGPYPLHDLASVLLAQGKDPLATNARLPSEVPTHHPLNDARQSARLLLAALATPQEAASGAVLTSDKTDPFMEHFAREEAAHHAPWPAIGTPDLTSAPGQGAEPQ